MEKTQTLYLDTPAASIALSPDENLLAVVGIHLFKIYTVHDDGHLEDFINIRSTKAANLNYSSSDVEFCPTDNKVLASASTNGSVVVWNITSSGRPKPIHVFKDHCRAVNRVNFHPTDQHLILSGSQDGQMKLFDYRRQESVGTFSSNSESVRDIQFNPHIPHYFAAGTDSCNVQLWDMRRPDKYERLITGHRDHVFALDWHPVDRHCIATASRDYTIKIWDVSEQSLTVTSAISTVAAVARVKWRPNHYYHLASCSLTVDSSAFIWDVERPFVPIASFAYHRESTSALQWRSSSDSFLTVSKDGRLFHHCLKDAQYPRLRGCPFPLAVSPLGHIACAAPLRAANRDRALAERSSKIELKSNSISHKRQTSVTSSLIGTSAPSSPASPFGPSSFSSSEKILTPLHPATPSLPPNPKHNEHLLNFPPPHMGMKDLANFEDIGPILSEFSLLRCSSHPLSSGDDWNTDRSCSNAPSKAPESQGWNMDEDDGGCFSVDTLRDYAMNYMTDGASDRALVRSCDHNAMVAARNKRPHEAASWQILKVIFVSDLSLEDSVPEAGLSFTSPAAAAAGAHEKLDSRAGDAYKVKDDGASSSPDKASSSMPGPPPHRRRADDDRTIFRHEDEDGNNDDSDEEDEAEDLPDEGVAHNSGSYGLRARDVRGSYLSDSAYFDSLSAPVPDRLPVPTASSRRATRRLNDFQELRRKIVFKDRPLSSNEELMEIKDEAFEPKALSSYKIEDPNLLGETNLELNHRDDEFDLHDQHLHHHNQDDGLIGHDHEDQHRNMDSGGDSGEQESGGSDGKCVLALTMPLSVDTSAIPALPDIDFSDTILETLKYMALRGDLASCVTVILVAGERVKNVVPEDLLEHWFLMYVELLQRLRLFNQACEVIQKAPKSLSRIREMNQNSTKISMLCPHCYHPVGKRQFTCEKCHQVVNKCSWCHESVRGLYVYCQGCCHGGHLQHLYNWFRDNNNIYKNLEEAPHEVTVTSDQEDPQNGEVFDNATMTHISSNVTSPAKPSSNPITSSTPSTISMRPFSSYFNGLGKHASTFTSGPTSNSSSFFTSPVATAPPPPPPPPPAFNGNPFMGNVVGTNVFASPHPHGYNIPNFTKMANLVCPAGCGHLCQYM